MQQPRSGFSAVLVFAMVGSTFGLAIISILASSLIDEFGISREQLGSLVTMSALSGAVLAPVLGPWADRIGARNATLFSLGVSSVSLAAFGLSTSFAVLLVAVFLTGVTQGIANPATNKLISMYVPRGRRGVIMGVKQSGVQLGNAVGGLVLPAVAVAVGWRFGVLGSVSVPAAGFALALWSVPRTADSDARGRGRVFAGTRAVWRLTGYGFLLGFGGTAVFTYLPLFAQERLGLDAISAGTAVSVMGVVGVASRIAWGRLSEGSLGSDRALFSIAALSVLLGVALVGAESVGPWTLWPIAVLAGASAAAWNSVGMLAVIERVPAEAAGGASGLVMAGFLGGLGLGAPAFGRSVDRLGDYRVGWIAVTVVFVAASVLWWRPARQSPDA